jgi:AsmA protein
VSAATGIKRIGLAVIALVAAGFGALLVLSLVIPAETVREQVKAQIFAVTGLAPVVSGEVSVSLFPTGSVRFHDVSLGDSRTGTSALTADEVAVRLRFLPFLIGRIEIKDVTLVRPIIRVVFEPGGRSNWAGHVETLARALQPTPGRMASFTEIRIADGTVVLHDEGSQVVERLTDVEFALAWPSISRSFAATGRFVWHGETIDAMLSLTDFVATLVGDRSGLKLRLAGAPLKLAFDGYLSHKPTLRVEGTLAADTASLRETLNWTSYWSTPGGGFGRFALKAQTNVVGNNISLSGVNIELDGNAGEGVLTFAGDGRKTLQGTLAVERLDLTPYVSTARELTGGERSTRRLMVLDGFNGVDVDLRLSAARVALANVKLGRTAIAANLRGGNLTLAVGESQVFGGMVAGSIGLANSQTGAELKAQLQFSDVDLDQCLGELMGIRRVEGKGNLALTLESSGATASDLARSLNGAATLSSRKGVITGVNVEQLLRRLERNPLSGRNDFRGGKSPYDLLTVNLKIAQGNAHVDDMRIEGPGVRLAIGGLASVPARELDLKGIASLLTSTAAEAPPAFELPFVVQGPWDDPIILPDAQILIRRSGAAAPLVDAIRKNLKRDSVQPGPALASEPPTGATVAPPTEPPSRQ